MLLTLSRGNICDKLSYRLLNSKNGPTKSNDDMREVDGSRNIMARILFIFYHQLQCVTLQKERMRIPEQKPRW